MNLRILAEAEAEILEAASWYEDRRENLGIEFQDCVFRKIDEVAKDGERFPKYEMAPDNRDVRRALLNRFPYIVLFEVCVDEILIIAIAHASRDSLYWGDR